MRYYYEQPNEISGTLRRNAAIKDLLQRIFVSSQFSLLISKEWGRYTNHGSNSFGYGAIDYYIYYRQSTTSA